MIRRSIEDSIRQALADTPVVLLNGARQTGKTTLAQAIAQQTGALYFTLLETFVVSELSKQLSWTDPRTLLLHFRTAAGSEVDVVLERADGSVAGVEVKASATVGSADFVALQALRDQLGKRFNAGVLLYQGDQVLPCGDKLWLVPLPTLWAE